MKGTVHTPSVTAQLPLIEFRNKIMYSRPVTGLFVYLHQPEVQESDSNFQTQRSPWIPESVQIGTSSQSQLCGAACLAGTSRVLMGAPFWVKTF